MFAQCESLLFLPEISKWNTKKLKDMEDMFKNTNIKNIPDKFKSCIIF